MAVRAGWLSGGRAPRVGGRWVLRQRLAALLNAVLVILGGQILLLGAGLELDVLSLRRIVEHQRFGRLIVLVVDLRARLTHPQAQALELLLALLGTALIAAGVTRELLAWWRLARAER
jgi:hypothetical protein